MSLEPLFVNFKFCLQVRLGNDFQLVGNVIPLYKTSLDAEFKIHHFDNQIEKGITSEIGQPSLTTINVIMPYFIIHFLRFKYQS